MIKRGIKAAVSAVIVSSLVATPALATNGYFTHGTGTKNKGMAGAGLAQPEGSIFIANNPAAALYGVGQLDVGLAIFNPNRSYTTTESQANGQGGAFTIGPQSLDSDKEYFPIPHIAYGWKISDQAALGLAFYGRGGMNTQWNGGTATFDPDGPGPAPVMTMDGTFGGGKAGVDLSQAFLEVAYARRTNDNFSWGLAAVVAVQSFEASGLSAFAGYTESFAASGGTAFPSSLSDNSHEVSTGIGAKIGFQSQLTPGVAIAGAYQTEIGMSEFDDYSDLFAGGGSFDIPANAKLGISFKTSETLTLNFDIETTFYSDVPSVGNPLANLFGCPTINPLSTDLSGCLGGSNGAGFGWDDMTAYKVGVEYKASDTMTWRAGFSTGEQPIPDSEVLFNILAPAVIENHLTFGFSRMTKSGGEWNFAFMYAPEGDVAGLNPFDPTQRIELSMDQFELEVGYTWRF